ncbi:hypothetical protein N7456_007393, partial [Penicillium angulare]
LALLDIFLNNIFNSNPSTIVSNLNISSKSKAKLKSKDKLVLDNKEDYIIISTILLIISIKNIFLILEIIFDLTLVFSPYIFLLDILFRIDIFKYLSKDSLRKHLIIVYYSIGIHIDT